jgi:predicted GIY-YIG superfamily endonuclease
MSYLSLLYLTLLTVPRGIMSKRAHNTRPSGHCCYILQSESWPTPYTGKTCNLARRLYRHNHPSKRSRAYTKGKGPWRVAAAVYGMRSNRHSVWLERALKRHAKGRARLTGLSAVQTAVLDAVRVSSRPSLWWRGEPSAAPPLHIQVCKCALTAFPDQLLFDAMPTSTTARVSCHRQHEFPRQE